MRTITRIRPRIANRDRASGRCCASSRCRIRSIVIVRVRVYSRIHIIRFSLTRMCDRSRLRERVRIRGGAIMNFRHRTILAFARTFVIVLVLLLLLLLLLLL